ncbi:hypothetical protein H5410_021029 [Solanum commersonii]|uniref:Uncharacterized protein n=1 Tax=Solanum commersonii TaxID=4109 RepID=A0A9J5ZE09_SOLCO|nr:hypothetical protein H5410_021029 [Solanum commersonii]
MYMEEVKRDLKKNLDIDIGVIFPWLQRSDHSNEEIHIDALLAKFQEQVKESSSKATCKGKNKM